MQLKNISDDNDSDLPLIGSLTTCRNFPITPTNDYGTKITLTPNPEQKSIAIKSSKSIVYLHHYVSDIIE